MIEEKWFMNSYKVVVRWGRKRGQKVRKIHCRHLWMAHGRYQLGLGSSINDVTIYYDGRGSMIEKKWLMNSNKVPSCNRWGRKRGQKVRKIF